MPVVDSEGKALFRLEDEIRKKREEEDEKLMEKYAEIEANYQKSDTEDGLTFCRLEESRQGSAWRRNSWPGLIRRLVEQPALSRCTIWDRMGVLFPWDDVCFLYLPVFSFFDLVCSQSYSCVTCSELRQQCFSSRCRGPRTVEPCRKWVRRSEDRSDRRGCGNGKREQDGMRKRMGGRRNMRQ